MPREAIAALDAYVASLTDESAFKTRSDLVRFIITDWLKRRRLL